MTLEEHAETWLEYLEAHIAADVGTLTYSDMCQLSDPGRQNVGRVLGRVYESVLERTKDRFLAAGVTAFVGTKSSGDPSDGWLTSPHGVTLAHHLRAYAVDELKYRRASSDGGPAVVPDERPRGETVPRVPL